MKVKVKCKANKIRTEKEIRDRLAIALEDLEYLREAYHDAYKDKDIEQLYEDIIFVEAEVKTLRWVLCD